MIIVFLIILFGVYFGIGVLVSKVEKNKGWTEEHEPRGFYEKHMKRPLDFSLALFGLSIIWPLLLVIAIGVRINMGTPIVFTQERPGLGGKIFLIRKFRTMTDERDMNGTLLSDEERLTLFGRFLRKTSGDEILELINILRGEMSFVGPRPLLVRYLPAYTEEEKHRHDVRPGLSGLAQVNGRNYVPWNERLAYDVKYVNNITFLGDVKIVIKTIQKVIKHEDIAANTDEIDEGLLDEIRGVNR